jgi:hypothetical protein
MDLAVVRPRESQVEASERLAREIGPVCGHLNVFHAQLVRCTVEALATTAWGGVGITSPEHWLCLVAGVSPGRAAQIVAVARRWRGLPVTMAAFSVGELSFEQVVVVAKTVRSCNDAEACAVARHALVSQLSYALRKYRYGPSPSPKQKRGAATDDNEAGHDHEPDADTQAETDAGGDGAGPPGADPAGGSEPAGGSDGGGGGAPDPRVVRGSAPNRVWFGFDDDGRYRVSFDLDALHGAVVDKALREARNGLFNEGKPSSFADALVEMAARSLAAVASADRRDLYRVYLHLDVGGAWVDQGPAVPSLLFDRITCDGTAIVVGERKGRPVEIHEPTKTVPNHLRRFVLDRDRHCRFPGCGRHVHLEVHHVVHRADLGPSTLANLAALCPLHHDLVHRGQLAVAGDADVPGGLTFADPATGATLGERRPPVLPGDAEPPGPPPGHRWRHPDGERLHRDCLVFREPPPGYAPPPGDPPHTRPEHYEYYEHHERPDHHDRHDHSEHAAA